jgi:hypothetical protein
MRAEIPTHLILLDLIILINKLLVEECSYEDPYYAVFVLLFPSS